MNNNQAIDSLQPGFHDLLAQTIQVTWFRSEDTNDAPLQRVANIVVLERLLPLVRIKVPPGSPI